MQISRAGLTILILLCVSGVFVWWKNQSSSSVQPLVDNQELAEVDDEFSLVTSPLADSLSIDHLKKGNYSGSPITTVETLSPGSNYQRYLTSYESEGNTIYALLTIPNGPKPDRGWPVIIFNHGYIPPEQYRTTEKYIAYTDAFSKNGYIVFRSDYRGHGNSEGLARGGYGSNDYTIDILNAVASVKQLPQADPKRIGMWGHSMGGFITLRAMVVNPEIKAGVIWAGVVGSYPDLLNNWRRSTFTPPPLPSGARRWRQALVETYGDPETNPEFWNSISANSYLSNLAGPIQLHHGTADTSVPIEFSQTLLQQLEAASKSGELFTYTGDDHNLSQNFNLAMKRTLEFFDTHLKSLP